jgi:predicted metal-binding protein
VDKEQRAIKRHLFVCTNEKEEGVCCSQKGSASLIQNIKNKLRENDLFDDYKITKTGCLGPCSSGIAATMYPDNILFKNLELSDEDELYNLLTKPI